jgi:hypothetical protein
MVKTTAVVVALLLSPPPLAFAERGVESLRGLSAVVFSVHSYGNKSQPVLWGVDGDLRRAGLKLVSEGDDTEGRVPRLDLDLTLACTGRSCGYSVRLQLAQRARLSRRPNVESTATTWADGYQNGIGRADLATLNDLYIADSRALIKSFLDDYRAANPGR